MTVSAKQILCLLRVKSPTRDASMAESIKSAWL